MYLSPTLFLKPPLGLVASLPIDVLDDQGSIPKGSRFYGAGYIGRNHAHPRNHGAVSDETKIPRLPKAIVGSKSIRTLPSLLWRPEARATLEIAKYDPGAPPR